MHSLLNRFLVLSLVAFVGLTITSCNIEGLFTKIGDDPVFVDPDAPVATAGTAEAGGVGKTVYGRICAACHLGSGKGVPGNNIPPLAGSPLVVSDPSIPIRIVLHGFKGPIERNGVTINGQMAAWKDQLSDQDVADVLTYVRSAFGNSASAITPDEVSTVRGETSSRLAPFTESELK
ncbi:MAG: cytochrome c [Ignavibacteria bacterium]|nr:cytochrome c [Ignavibacteria bacterium]